MKSRRQEVAHVKAKKLANRDIYEVAWGDEGEVEGETVVITFANQVDGDVSQTTDVNDGTTTVSVGSGWTGADRCTVKGSDGGEFGFDVEFSG